MKKVPLELVTDRPTTGPQPPIILGEVGRNLWDRVTSAYDIADVAGQELLGQACAAADRRAACAALIDRDGEVIATKSGPREHPAMRGEQAARSFVVKTLRALGLDVEPIRPGPGRPGRGFGWTGERE